MARPDLPDLSALAQSGASISCRVTPRARREGLTLTNGIIHIAVAAPPEDGKANDAVRRMLARALGVAPTRLILTRGATARDKQFRLD